MKDIIIQKLKARIAAKQNELAEAFLDNKINDPTPNLRKLQKLLIDITEEKIKFE